MTKTIKLFLLISLLSLPAMFLSQGLDPVLGADRDVEREGPPAAPRRPIEANPAVLIPIAHGFAAMGTFVLAVMTASM